MHSWYNLVALEIWLLFNLVKVYVHKTFTSNMAANIKTLIVHSNGNSIIHCGSKNVPRFI